MAARANGLSSIPHRAARVLAEGGPQHLLLQALRKLTRPLLECGSVIFFARDLSEPPPEPRAALDLKLHIASPAQLDLLLNSPEFPQTEEMLRERFRAGDICFAALDAEGKLAHSRWVTTRRGYIPELDMELFLKPGEAYMYDGYTRPDLRGRGIDGFVRCSIFVALRAGGFNRLYSYVRGDNPVGLRAARRWLRPVGRLWYLRFRGARPLVLAEGGPELPVLIKRTDIEKRQQTRLSRARAWRAWFESWLDEPHAKRSSGFSALPEEYFVSAADYIVSALALDPKSDLVLDVGCDSAMISRLVAPHCLRLVGVDFIPGLLADIPDEAAKSASSRRACFVAADGRLLPFKSHVFTKAYCSAVIHTLPSVEDGARMIEELVRVCRPGGTILVASIPDRAKRFSAYLEAWRRSSLAGRLRLLTSLALPRPAKDVLRRLLGLEQQNQLISLDYDLEKLKRRLEAQGLVCQILDFPENYWSRDFRKTRSNLLICIPREWRADQPADTTGSRSLTEVSRKL